jgi:hypothetical protein
VPVNRFNAVFAWIREFARIQGDLESVAEIEYQLDLTHKSELFAEYKIDCKKDFVEDVGRTPFYETLNEQCSNITIRELKNVTGKCTICALFSELRRKSDSLAARAELTATF